jgi:UDP-glucose 4-epimerase
MSEKPDIVFHLAASKSVNDSIKNPVMFEEINVIGSKNVIDAAIGCKAKKIIFTSTAGVYGNQIGKRLQVESDTPHPSSPYATTKLKTEIYLQERMQQTNGQAAILRFANVYGGGGDTTFESAINVFIKKALIDETMSIHGDGSQVRDFIYIEDLIDACIALLTFTADSAQPVPIFNIATGIGITINDVVQLIGSILAKKIHIEYQEATYAGQKTSLLSPLKTKQILKWESTTGLKEGITKTINHYVKT